MHVSIDDFGQGYTSLGFLGHLPVSELKIDRTFVVAMQSSAEDRAIVASVIELGHQLGLTVVAEGVETTGVLQELDELGCDIAQGFLFARPMRAEEVQPWLRQHAADPGLTRPTCLTRQSSLMMVPMPVRCVIVAPPDTLTRLNENVSFGSALVSAKTGTTTTLSL